LWSSAAVSPPAPASNNFPRRFAAPRDRSLTLSPKLPFAVGAQRFACPRLRRGSVSPYRRMSTAHRNGARPQTMEREMTQLCELTQIGRIGNVKEVGQNLMISVASDASYKKDGEWMNRANWIEHTVFGRRDKMKDWALDTLQAGDLVFIRSTPSQTNWEKDGEKRYSYTMAVTELKLLTAKADLKQRAPADPQAEGLRPL